MTLTRRTVLCTALIGVALIGATAFARGPQRAPEPRAPYSVALEDARGSSLPAFWQHGQRFVLGEPGERYVIRIDNPTAERVEAVISVDGRDAISGRVGDYRTQRGYIIPPYGSVTVDGFRRSLDEIATFRFADPEDSYSARLGTPENVGVIGVAFFKERRRPLPPPVARDEAQRRRSSGARADAERPAPSAPRADAAAEKRSTPASSAVRRAPSASARERDSAPSGSVNNLGTEYGETRSSHVNEVTFERRGSRPSALVTLRYDDVQGLAARGIDVRPYRRVVQLREPQAFPNSRFAEPPP